MLPTAGVNHAAFDHAATCAPLALSFAHSLNVYHVFSNQFADVLNVTVVIAQFVLYFCVDV